MNAGGMYDKDFCFLAFDSGGNSAIAWNMNSVERYGEYAHRQQSSWITQTVSDIGVVYGIAFDLRWGTHPYFIWIEKERSYDKGGELKYKYLSEVDVPDRPTNV